MSLFIFLLAVPGLELGANTTLKNTNKYIQCEVLFSITWGGWLVRVCLTPERMLVLYIKRSILCISKLSLTLKVTQGQEVA